jgi:hypothetical protein
MIKRQQSRFPGRQGKQAPQRPAGKQTRRNFNSWLKEVNVMVQNRNRYLCDSERLMES